MTVGEFKKWVEENQVPDNYDLIAYDGEETFFYRDLDYPEVSTRTIGMIRPETIGVVVFNG
jgi:hypothetical protein